jgi:hypothetical protein
MRADFDAVINNAQVGRHRLRLHLACCIACAQQPRSLPTPCQHCLHSYCSFSVVSVPPQWAVKVPLILLHAVLALGGCSIVGSTPRPSCCHCVALRNTPTHRVSQLSSLAPSACMRRTQGCCGSTSKRAGGQLMYIFMGTCFLSRGKPPDTGFNCGEYHQPSMSGTTEHVLCCLSRLLGTRVVGAPLHTKIAVVQYSMLLVVGCGYGVAYCAPGFFLTTQ